MENVKEIDATFNHGISISERKNIIITGVKKIDSFDNEEFMMEIEIIKLDTYQGNVSIKGRIDSLCYLDSNLKKDKDSSFITKLFK